MLYNSMRSLLVSTSILFSLSPSNLFAMDLEDKIPPAQSKFRVATQEQLEAEEYFLDTLFCIYQARTRSNKILMQGYIPKQPQDYCEKVEEACDDGVSAAIRFQALEYLGYQTTSYNPEAFYDFPCLFSKDKRTAAGFITHYALEGDPFAVKYYLKGKLKGIYGFKKIEDKDRISFLTKWADKGHFYARKKLIQEEVNAMQDWETKKIFALETMLMYGNAGDSKMRVAYLRNSLHPDLTQSVDSSTEQNEALKKWEKWVQDGDKYVATHFNPDFKREMRLAKQKQLTEMSDELNAKKHLLPKEYQEIIKPEQLKEVLKAPLIGPLLLLVLTSDSLEEKPSAAKLEEYKRKKMEAAYKVSLPFAELGVKAARKNVINYLMEVDTKQAIVLLNTWAGKDDKWAQKSLLEYYISEAKKSDGGNMMWLKALSPDTVDEVKDQIHNFNYYNNKLREMMRFWHVIPSQMNRKLKESDSLCSIM